MRRTPRTRPQRPRLPLRDLLAESAAGLVARPARVALTVLGTVVGVAALVATLGLSKTASNQIVGRFDEVASTDIVVSPARRGARTASSVLSFRVEDALQRLNGVVAAGSLSDVNVGRDLVSSVPVNDPVRRTQFQMPVKAASPGLWRAVRARLATGRLPDAGHSARADRVVVLGPNAARQLNIRRVDQQPAVFLGDRLYLVIGILAGVERQPSLLGALVMPEGTAASEYRLQAPALAQIETRVGAVELIARQAPLVLSPTQSAQLKVSAPPNPRDLKGAIRNDLNTLFVLLGGVSLLVGAIGIANVTLVSVLERVGEIGLRRALGAARRHIAAQFLVESSAMGALGGLVGASIGLLVVVGVSATRTWTPVLDPAIPLMAPLLGARDRPPLLSGGKPEQTFVLAVDTGDFTELGGCTKRATDEAFGGTQLLQTLQRMLDELDELDDSIVADQRMVRVQEDWRTCVKAATGEEYEDAEAIEDVIKQRFELLVGGVVPPGQVAPEGTQVDAAALQKLQQDELDLSAKDLACERKHITPVESKVRAEKETKFKSDNAELLRTVKPLGT